ncbi:MAG: hypothetical protein ACPHQ9_10385 [Marinobacter sp.]|uniref:hypothetical protein n=1 Tax=Marinobacter sp. TaxID=50741 RepID=UPI003C3EBA61
MQYVSGFFLIPSTIVLVSYIATMLAGSPGRTLLDIQNPILDIGFLVIFFLSSLAGWLDVVFNVPFRDQGTTTLVGKGVVIGVVTLPVVFIPLLLGYRVALSFCLLMGWVGLVIQLVPALSSTWQRRAPVWGLVIAILALPFLINPFIWESSELVPVPEANWGIYYPDYDLEADDRFVAHYQEHERRFNTPPNITISKAGMVMINVLGSPLPNTFHHRGPHETYHLFSRNKEDGYEASSAKDTWGELHIEFHENGKLRCNNCRDFGKPEHWMRINNLPEGYKSPFHSL